MAKRTKLQQHNIQKAKHEWQNAERKYRNEHQKAAAKDKINMTRGPGDTNAKAASVVHRSIATLGGVGNWVIGLGAGILAANTLANTRQRWAKMRYKSDHAVVKKYNGYLAHHKSQHKSNTKASKRPERKTARTHKLNHSATSRRNDEQIKHKHQRRILRLDQHQNQCHELRKVLIVKRLS